MSAAAGPRGVLCVGRLYCDLIFTDVPRMPTLGTEVFAGGFGLHAGGGAFITAAYLSHLGQRTALGCMLPTPPFGAAVRQELTSAGLDLTFCRESAPGCDPQVTVAIATQGDRAFVSRRAGPACPDIAGADLSRAGLGHLHVGELATLVERPDLLAAARAAGASISLDCGWDDAVDAEAVARLLGQVDVFFPNATEMEQLAGLGLSGRLAPLVVVKQGAAGATAFAAGSEVSAPAEAVQAVDTTGAGDVFNAGFLAAWLGGAPLAACLQSGNAMGARAISGRGGFRG